MSMRSATLVLSLVAAFLLGCDKGGGDTAEPRAKAETKRPGPVEPDQPAPPQTPAPSPKTTDSNDTAMAENKDVELKWSLTPAPDGSHLRIEYELTNRLDSDIFVADQLLAYHGGQIKLVPDRVVVTAGKTSGELRFVRAVVKTNTTRMDHPPGARRLKPGATHQASAQVPLPLRGWHNYGTPPAIPDNPTSAVLEIAYLVGDSIQWGKIKTSDGKEVTIPQLPSYRQFARIASGKSTPLP